MFCNKGKSYIKYKKDRSDLVSTRRSTVPSLPVRLVFPGLNYGVWLVEREFMFILIYRQESRYRLVLHSKKWSILLMTLCNKLEHFSLENIPFLVWKLKCGKSLPSAQIYGPQIYKLGQKCQWIVHVRVGNIKIIVLTLKLTFKPSLAKWSKVCINCSWGCFKLF